MTDEQQNGRRPRFVWTNLLLVIILLAAMAALIVFQPWSEKAPTPKATGPAPASAK